MAKIVRLGDLGSHGGQVITAASKWRCEDANIARVGDLYGCDLHGANPIVSGSSKWTCEGKAIARIGDMTACGATLVTGASKWDCE